MKHTITLAMVTLLLNACNSTTLTSTGAATTVIPAATVPPVAATASSSSTALAVVAPVSTPTPTVTPSPTPSYCPANAMNGLVGGYYQATVYTQPDVTYPTETDTIIVTLYIYFNNTSDETGGVIVAPSGSFGFCDPNEGCNLSDTSGYVAKSSADHNENLWGTASCNYSETGALTNGAPCPPQLTFVQATCPAASVNISGNFQMAYPGSGTPISSTQTFTYNPSYGE